MATEMAGMINGISNTISSGVEPIPHGLNMCCECCNTARA